MTDNECVFCLFNEDPYLAEKMLRLNMVSATAIALLCEKHFEIFMKIRKESRVKK